MYPDCDIKILDEITKNLAEDIILTGHTHIPCGFSLENGKTIVNDGSVGRSMTKDKMPVYLLITITPNGEYGFEHIKVKYDNKKVSEIIKKRNFEFSEEFSKLYIEE